MEQRFKQALDTFSEKWKKDPNVIAIIATGSAVYGTPDKNSDLDVHVILNKAAYRERGNTWINGVEVEYFLNPIQQIESYLASEKHHHTAHMLSNGLVAYRKGKALDSILKEAKRILNTKSKPLTKTQKEMAKYFIDDLRKDLEDAYTKKDAFSLEREAQQLLEKCLETFYALKCIRIEKNKRLAANLRKHDEKFAELFITATNASPNTKFEAVNKVTGYIERLLGGQRTKEWRLRGPLDIRKPLK